MSRRVWPFVAIMLAGVVALGVAAVLLQRADGSVEPVADPAERERIGAQALKLVSFSPDRIGYEVRFAPGRAGVRAQIDRSERMISVYLRDGDAPHIVAHDIAHELGHAFDQTRMDDADRTAYLAARGLTGAAWLPAGDSDYASGAGDFAEVFSLCFAASPDFRSELAPRPEDPCELLPREAL